MNTDLLAQPCPIWSTPSAIGDVQGGRLGLTSVDSPRAGGKYAVEDTARGKLTALNWHDKVMLTSWLEEQRRIGTSIPVITNDLIVEAQQRKELRIAERVDRILRYLESKSRRLGTGVHLRFLYPAICEEPDDDHSIFYELLRYSESVDSDELTSLLNHLEERGYIKLIGFENNRIGTCFLTVKGYERLEETKNPNQDSTKVFVAMWFNPSMDEVWKKGFKPAITEAGYEPVRVDKQEHVNKIDDKIIAEIRRARFVVADFTHGNDGARGGVYYEAGFAHGLGIDVIFTCHKDKFDDLHFDTRQYNHISWSEPEELMNALKHRISAVYGDGPLINQ